jgi:hypothetical protein
MIELPVLQNSQVEPTGSPHNTLQTIAAIVVALATVFSVFTQAQNNPKLAVGLVALSIITMLVIGGGPLVARKIKSARIGRVQATRNIVAIGEYDELLRLARQFGKFARSQDPTNILQIIHSSCGNNSEKAAEICPADYISSVFPVFLQQLETHPAENETQLLQAATQLHVVIACFNRDYVSEPFRRMRAKRWTIANPSVVHEALGNTNPGNPNQSNWLLSLPPQYQENAARQIEDFRERWANFLDEVTQWLEHINETFGSNLATWLERPQKL